MIKYVLKRKDTGTMRTSTINGPMYQPGYTSKIDNAMLMSRRMAQTEQILGLELLVPVALTVNAIAAAR
jgi:hypothetical protein